MVMKKVKQNARQLDGRVNSSDLPSIRTASYVLGQARDQEKLFAKTITEATQLCNDNVVMAARICVMREVVSTGCTRAFVM